MHFHTVNICANYGYNFTAKDEPVTPTESQVPSTKAYRCDTGLYFYKTLRTTVKNITLVRLMRYVIIYRVSIKSLCTCRHYCVGHGESRNKCQ